MQLPTLFFIVPLLVLILNMYEATPIIESRATRPRRKLYDFQFSWTNSSDSEDRTGEAGFKVLGYMRDFGRIEGGSSFTYDGDPDFGQSFSNEYNIGTSDEDTNKPINGLGGGYTFNETNLDVGAGISAFDQKVNFQLDIGKGGNVFIHFDLSGSSAAKLNCQPDNTTATANDTVGMTCTVQTSS